MNNLINVTLFTDASHCPELEVAGGAWWARDSDNRDHRYFDLPQGYSAQAAELGAALTGAENILSGDHCLTVPDVPWRLILVTDCLAVKRYLETGGGCGELPPGTKERTQELLAHLEIEGGILKINHVPAHKGTGSPRNWVNNWCDRHAKIAMRRQRAALSGGIE